MAGSSAFKIQCPSCEAMVTIRDASLVGKKVACPKCKYRFVVEKPEEDEEDDDKPAGGPKKKGSKAAEDDGKKGKKKKADGGILANKKLLLGVGLAAVALVVLMIAGFSLFGGSGKPKDGGIGRAKLDSSKGADDKDEEDDKTADKNGQPKDKDNVKDKDKGSVPPRPPGGLAGAELTNLLPAGSQSVFAFHLRPYLESNIGHNALFAVGAFKDDRLRQRLGFSLKSVDVLYRADSFQPKDRWTFTVLHTTESFDSLASLTEALGLQPVPPVEKIDYFVVTKGQGILQGLPRLSLGITPAVTLPASGQGKLFLRVHDRQTLVFGQETPMLEYIKALATPTKIANATFVALKPDLRAMLHKLEFRPGAAKDKLLFNSATELAPARKAVQEDDPGRQLWQMRPFWDLSYLMRGRLDHVTVLGTALFTKDDKHFSYLNEFDCDTEESAKALEREVKDRAAPEFAFLQDKLLQHRIQLPLEKKVGEDVVKPPPDGKQPEEQPVSRIIVEENDKTVQFALELLLDKTAADRLERTMQLMTAGLKGELDAADIPDRRHELAQAGKALGEKGLKDPKVDPGNYPPGAFPRPPTTLRTSSAPNQRVSWMAGLLPYLDHTTLYQSIYFDRSWKDAFNWLPARTLVPQFIDPSFPPTSRYLLYPGLPLDAAATHYVGLAGIGFDAAEYGDKDAAVAGDLGVFGYDRGASLKDIQGGHGAANTILMIRVNWDGAAGVTPWMAGGGSTVRSVPKKDSLEPFLATEPDRTKIGTYVLMVDGSVRYIKKGMSDEVFQALATFRKPLPKGFKLDDEAPLVPLPSKVEPPKKVLPKKEPDKKDKDDPKKESKISLDDEFPIALFSEAAGGKAPEGWKEFNSPLGGFTVLFPGDKKEYEQKVLDELGGGKRFGVGSFASKTLYLVEYFDVSKKLAELPPDKQLAKVAQALSTNWPDKTKVLKESPVKLNGFPGREFVLERDGQRIVLRVYRGNNRFYSMMGSGPSDEHLQAFLASFKINPAGD